MSAAAAGGPRLMSPSTSPARAGGTEYAGLTRNIRANSGNRPGHRLQPTRPPDLARLIALHSQAMASELNGKRALVTGASRGIGREVARVLAAAGVAVAVNYKTNEQQARDLVREIASSGGTAIAVGANVASDADAARMVDETRRGLGGIDILINNAAVALPRTIDAVTAADWDRTMTTNLRSAFVVTQGVVKEMRERGWGRLVFLSSVAAQVGGVVGPDYAASKAGLHGLMHFYAAHLAKEGITSNVVAPALIDTDMVRLNPNARKDLIPVGRFGLPGEVASLILEIVRNGYINGQTINVNGGWYLT